MSASEPSGAILRARGVTKVYGGRGASRKDGVTALRDVDLEVCRGEALGLVGESGSGKSTLGRLLLRLEPPTSGAVLFEGRDLAGLSGSELRAFRRRAQIVFQDPFASLNPRLTVERALTEVLRVHGLARGGAAAERVTELLRLVGLDPAFRSRYPHEFSGGQRQRVGIARALAVEPEVIVADEPVSALDVSVQAQVLNLLADLRERLGLTYLFISHDLAVVRQVCDRVAVMKEGSVVETGPTSELFRAARDPYTRLLLASIPRLPRPAR